MARNTTSLRLRGMSLNFATEFICFLVRNNRKVWPANLTVMSY